MLIYDLTHCWDLLLLQETLLSDDDKGLLDILNFDFDNAFLPAVLKNNTFV